MALINCPECNKEVSDKASACIHCGYPLKHEVVKDAVKVLQNQESQMIAHNITNIKPMYLYSYNKENKKVSIECGNCEKIYNFNEKYFSKIEDTYVIPNANIVCPNCNNGTTFNTKIESRLNHKIFSKNANTSIKCPKCGSTQIQAVPRKWSLMTGFLTNKVDRVCLNCKHKF